MSHLIEQGKRVITLNLKEGEDKRFSVYGEERPAVFMHASASNNVFPRTFNWNWVSYANRLCSWGGEIQLPSDIWELGRPADGGSIKPWGKYVSGLAYIKSWKKAAGKPLVAFSDTGEALWQPMLYIDTPEPDGGYVFNVPENTHYDKEAIISALRLLFPEQLTRGNFAKGTTKEKVLAIVYLKRMRGFLEPNFPFSVYVEDEENASFYKTEQVLE